MARGKTLYAINCQACHGADLRGGDLGRPNLLRSQVVLSDQNGELILPIVQGCAASTGMPAIQMDADDVKAAATYIHEVVATSRGQGAPPDSGVPLPNVLIGDAAAGQQYFAAKCGRCHSATGDMQGVATRYPRREGSAKSLGFRRRRRARGQNSRQANGDSQASRTFR